MLVSENEGLCGVTRSLLLQKVVPARPTRVDGSSADRGACQSGGAILRAGDDGLPETVRRVQTDMRRTRRTVGVRL